MAKRKITSVARDFKGIWIPSEYWLNADLSITKIVFMAEIDSLASPDKPCFASNSYFADFFGLSSVRVSQIISELVESKLLKRRYERTETGEITKRFLTINPEKRVLNSLSTPIKNTKGGIKFPLRGYKENFKENNTINNTVNINNNNKGTKIHEPVLKNQEHEKNNSVAIDQKRTTVQETKKAVQNQSVSKYEDPITLYRENSQFMPPDTISQLLDWISDFKQLSGDENIAFGIVSVAVHQALDANALNIGYIRTILLNWRDKKVSTVEMATKAINEHQQAYKNKAGKSSPKEQTFLQRNSNIDYEKMDAFLYNTEVK